MKCPNCAGTVKVLSQTAMFCLDCDWDNLEERDFSRKTRPVDVEWYTKMQLKEYRRWKEGDFLRVQPDWIGGYRYNNRHLSGYQTYYFHRSTVEAHEVTPQFQEQVRRWQKRQLPVPEDEKIKEFAWTLCVLGDELIKNGWSYAMIDKLPPYRQHKWRKKHLFRLCDLSKVSETFKITA